MNLTEQYSGFKERYICRWVACWWETCSRCFLCCSVWSTLRGRVQISISCRQFCFSWGGWCSSSELYFKIIWSLIGVYPLQHLLQSTIYLIVKTIYPPYLLKQLFLWNFLYQHFTRSSSLFLETASPCSLVYSSPVFEGLWGDIDCILGERLIVGWFICFMELLLWKIGFGFFLSSEYFWDQSVFLWFVVGSILEMNILLIVPRRSLSLLRKRLFFQRWVVLMFAERFLPFLFRVQTKSCFVVFDAWLYGRNVGEMTVGLVAGAIRRKWG